MNSMTIGELASRFGLATHVLRHWEEMGLLTPAERVNGRRRYDERQAARVAMIVRGKEGGLSLEQLRGVLTAPTPGTRRELLRLHHAELERKLRQIQVSKEMVEHALECEAEDFTQCPVFGRLVEGLASPPGGMLPDHRTEGES